MTPAQRLDRQLDEFEQGHHCEKVELRGGCTCFKSAPCWRCSGPLTMEEAQQLGFEPDDGDVCPRDACADYVFPETLPNRPKLVERRGVMSCPKCGNGYGPAPAADDDPMRAVRGLCR